MTEPWVFDSNNIDFSNNVESILHRNENIDRFLNTSKKDTNLFLVGPKGIGKTFLLSYKSYLLRQHHKEEIKFSPATELLENISIFFTQFSKEEILKFQSPDIWENVWKYVLLGVACSSSGIDVRKLLSLEDVNFSKASSILSYLLSDRKNLNKALTFGLTKLLAEAGKIQSAVYIFIDGIDHAVDSLVDQKFYDFGTYQDTPVKVWTNIHIGIAKSIYDINILNAHIKVFTTIRNEAFKLIPGGMGMNLNSFAIHLSYSPSELHHIFTKNIKLVDNKKLISSNKEDFIEKFLGFGEMGHPFILGKTETSFEFLLRHTLNRPREIVFLGHKLFYEKLTKDDYKTLSIENKVEEVRFFINEQSEEILRNYLKEIIPSFDEEYLFKFLRKIQSNIFHHKILTEDEKKFLGICYNIGLIGVINQRVNAKGEQIKIQNFRNAGDYVYHSINHFPKSEYYVTHPILDCLFSQIFTDFYNNSNIIGNKKSFTTPEYIFDYAISYSSADKAIVEAITSELKNKGMKIFFDKDFEKEYLGVDLIDNLFNVYKKSAKNVLVFISDNYLKTKWTSLEMNAIKQRLVNDFSSNFIKIIRIGNANLPELIETRAYINAERKSPTEIAELLS